MKSEWPYAPGQRRIADFTDSLAQEIELDLENIPGVKVDTSALDKNSGFMIYVSSNGLHRMEVMVSENRKSEGALVIDRFEGIRPVSNRDGQSQASTPLHLRQAADTYEAMQATLDRRFGKPVSVHDGRAIYTTRLEEQVA